jgi:endogenous inhibitor of DNA gyrase (YacG/DUF329 family)
MTDSPWRDKQALKKLYIDEQLTTYEIAVRWGCSDVTVSDWLGRHEIPARDPNPPTMKGESNPRQIGRDTLIKDYQDVAAELGKTPSQIEYNNHGEYTWSAIRGYFDGMGELQDAAGLERLDKGRVDKVCEHCGRDYDVRHANKDSKYCSERCSDLWKIEAYSGQGNPFGYIYREINCEMCGKLVEDSNIDQRFCSQECMIKWRSSVTSGENHPRWNPDTVPSDRRGYRGENWDEQRQKALDRDDYECQACGEGETLPSLHVHHIEPWSSFADDEEDEANRVENLLSLCASCHLKLEWGSHSVQADISHFGS